MCDQCKIEKETVLHFFFECQKTKQVWRRLLNYVQDRYEETVSINDLTGKMIILNQTSNEINCLKYIDLLIYITKQMLYAAKCKGTKCATQNIINEFEFVHKLEREQAQTATQKKRYNNKWPDKIEIEYVEDETID